MSMQWNIKYPKDLKQEAAEQGKYILALGYECGTRAEFMHYKTDEEIFVISNFAIGLHGNADPRELLDKVLTDLEAAKARLAERKRLKAEEPA